VQVLYRTIYIMFVIRKRIDTAMVLLREISLYRLVISKDLAAQVYLEYETKLMSRCLLVNSLRAYRSKSGFSGLT
jgi:hypothetical protein